MLGFRVGIWQEEASQNQGSLLGGPHNEDYSMLRPRLGSPCTLQA